MFLVRLIGAAAHATERFVKHDERGVRQDRFHLTSKNDQSRRSSLRIKSPEMLSAENGRFPSNRCVARTVNAWFAILADPKFSNDLQPFDNPDQILLPRRFRPFTQPRERRSASIVADRNQRLQSGNGLVLQAVNEALVR